MKIIKKLRASLIPIHPFPSQLFAKVTLFSLSIFLSSYLEIHLPFYTFCSIYPSTYISPLLLFFPSSFLPSSFFSSPLPPLLSSLSHHVVRFIRHYPLIISLTPPYTTSICSILPKHTHDYQVSTHEIHFLTFYQSGMKKIEKFEE